MDEHAIQTITSSLEAINNRLDRIDQRFDEQDSKWDKRLNERFDKFALVMFNYMDKRFSRIETRLDDLGTKLES